MLTKVEDAFFCQCLNPLFTVAEELMKNLEIVLANHRSRIILHRAARKCKGHAVVRYFANESFLYTLNSEGKRS